jgi:hypothetical protein
LPGRRRTGRFIYAQRGDRHGLHSPGADHGKADVDDNTRSEDVDVGFVFADRPSLGGPKVWPTAWLTA